MSKEEETAIEEGLRLIKRIEFHEGKSKNLIIPYVETRFYVSDLKAFVQWCAGEQFDEGIWNFNIKRTKKSKSKRPVFGMFIRHTQALIYPRENMVAVREAGLHHICQHSFDILPREASDLIYASYENVFDLGYLYTLHGEKLLVKNSDIHDGFMLPRDKVDAFNNSFANWIRSRRKERF